MRRIPILACLIANVCFAARPVIFDTDMGNDIDDALALAVLHALSDRGECDLIGVTLTNAHPAAVPYIRMANRFYGRGDLPVGAAIKELKDGANDHYMRAAMRTAPAASASPAELAPTLLRRLLSNAREKVVIVQTGFSTNLAALLDSPGGAALAKEKVALVVAMAGNFAGGEPEYNVRIDVASAKAVFERWPTPIVFSGYEIGRDLLYPAASIEHDFAYARPHPIAESYRANSLFISPPTEWWSRRQMIRERMARLSGPSTPEPSRRNCNRSKPNRRSHSRTRRRTRENYASPRGSA